ncbi:4-oxalomesaconate tautomerase [uncultured Cohaesibacter sp.]|uniref:4-oxalomesaconate tautomerase n=1 Tax=uncultured Cohaesibacter sp. TaxID=1002546 RepID=UPI003747CBF9
MAQDGTRVMWMRGGTSKGGVFLAEDLPADVASRDALLLRIMGSPDPRQIDGMGGADPLTSKVAVVSRSQREGVDVEYLFLQVFVDRAIVSDAQNCGNMLSAVGPFAIERGIVVARDGETPVSIFMANTGQVATALVQTPKGKVSYLGSAQIDGVPGTAAPVALTFSDTEGSSCGSLLPTGNTQDLVDGTVVTMIDNGMPCVLVAAGELGLRGDEPPAELEADAALCARVEALRLLCGPMMNLGDVSSKSVPKMTIVSPPGNGGAIRTRSFIPHHCHKAIGVLGAVSVASACLLEDSVAAAIASTGGDGRRELSIEHPTGETTVIVELDQQERITSAAILRTARKLMDGVVFGEQAD